MDLPLHLRRVIYHFPMTYLIINISKRGLIMLHIVTKVILLNYRSGSSTVISV